MFKIKIKKNPDLIEHTIYDLKRGDMIFLPRDGKYYKVKGEASKSPLLTIDGDKRDIVRLEKISSTMIWLQEAFLFEGEKFKLVSKGPKHN